MRISTLNLKDYYGCFTVVELMLNLLYFVVTVLTFIAHFRGLIIRSLLIASLELLSTMSIVVYYKYLQGVVSALCMQLITLVSQRRKRDLKSKK